MLAELSIENFAIIDRLLVRFENGFTVITGETGAGKSIIIDAMHAALGARVAADAVRSGARFAAVEAVFDVHAVQDNGLAALAEETGIDLHDGLILRREINMSGRTTARVNGRAVPMSTLASLGELLVDIHGQSDHLSVLRRDRQLDVLDRFGLLFPLRGAVAEAARDLSQLRGELAELQSGQRESEQRLDLLRFQWDEIAAAHLRPGEEEELVAERNLLANAERIVLLAVAARERMHGETGNAVDTLSDAQQSLHELTSIDPSRGGLAERLDSAVIEVEDIAQELRSYADSIDADMPRLAAVEERLDLMHRLERKYGETVDDVIAFGLSVREQLDAIENYDDRLAELRDRVDTFERETAQLATRLSSARRETATVLSQNMRDALQGLGLQGTEFDISLTTVPASDGLPLGDDGQRVAFGPAGIDLISFLASFNPGEELRPLDRVASGGETSRFLLALKSVLAGADAVATLVFDEVDVGVGGRHGLVVGERLRALSETHQVLAITHLPQVAALADHHLTVSKAILDGRTSTVVREIDAEERVVEIAEMMSGTGTETARRNAAELLETARHGRSA